MCRISKVSISISKSTFEDNLSWTASLSCYSARDIAHKTVLLHERKDSADAAIVHGETEAFVLFPRAQIHIAPSARLYIGREDLSLYWGIKKSGFIVVVSIREVIVSDDKRIYRSIVRRYNSRPSIVKEIICETEHLSPISALESGIEYAHMMFPSSEVLSSPVAERIIKAWSKIDQLKSFCLKTR